MTRFKEGIKRIVIIKAAATRLVAGDDDMTECPSKKETILSEIDKISMVSTNANVDVEMAPTTR